MAATAQNAAQQLVVDFSLQVAKTRVEIHDMLSVLLSPGAHQEAGGHGDHGAHHDASHGIDAIHVMYELYRTTVYHFIIDVFNLVGVGILCFAAVGVIPELVSYIIPAMFWRIDPHLSHGRYLKARMQLGRGIMLAMDFMVASDILETLLGTPGIWNIFKILCIVAVRSWLAYERATEVTEMEKEYDHWEKEIQEEEEMSMQGSFHGSSRSLLRADSFSSLQRDGSLKSLSRSNSFDSPLRQNSFFNKFKNQDLTSKIESTFEDLDADKDGYIVEKELRAGLDKMGINASDVKIKNMMGGKDQMSFDVFNTFIRRMAMAESFAESIAEGEEEDGSGHEVQEDKKTK